MYKSGTKQRLKTLSPTTEDDIDLDLIDQQLQWLGNVIITQRKFACELCGNDVDSICHHENLGIKSEPDCTTEIEIQHPEENKCPKSFKLFGCRGCKAKFKTYENLQKHKKTICKQRFKCNTCGKFFEGKIALNIHLNNHNTQERPYICQECGNTSKSKIDFQTHMKTHPNLSVCDICDKYFTHISLKKHRLSDHNKAMQNLDGFNSSTIVINVQPNPRRQDHSYGIDTPYFICKECGNTSKSKIDFQTHMKTHPNLSVCDICDKYFTHISLKKHRLSDHNKAMQNLDGFKYTCDLCPAKFKSRQGLKIHKATHSDQEKPFACKNCESTFGTEKLLKLHFKECKQNYSCKTCQKKFVWLRWLKYHEIGCDGGQNEAIKKKPLHCKKCGKRFKTKQILGRHDRFVHTDDRPFACKECDKRFQTKMILRTHMRVHTGEKPFKCQVCGMTFAYHQGLKNHVTQGICNYIVDESND